MVGRTGKNCTEGFKSEKNLSKLNRMQLKLDLPWSEVTDAGHTQISPGTTTCISLGPAPEEKIDKITGDLKTTVIFFHVYWNEI